MKLMMKKFPWLILLLAPALAVAAQPRSIALTIQENGHVQVSETHDLDPPDKDGMIRVSPLPETLLPASVNATPLERGETFEIIAQRFDYDFVLTIIIAITPARISCQWAATAARSSDMPTARKNRPSNRPRKGSMSASSW